MYMIVYIIYIYTLFVLFCIYFPVLSRKKHPKSTTAHSRFFPATRSRMYAMHSATTGKSFAESWVSETTASFTFFLKCLPVFPVDGYIKDLKCWGYWSNGHCGIFFSQPGSWILVQEFWSEIKSYNEKTSSEWNEQHESCPEQKRGLRGCLMLYFWVVSSICLDFMLGEVDMKLLTGKWDPGVACHQHQELVGFL